MLLRRNKSSIAWLAIASLIVACAFVPIRAAAQAITCPTGQMPVPIMPADGSTPTGPVKMKCVTPQEAMQIMAAAQQEMMKKLSSGGLPGVPPSAGSSAGANAGTANDAAAAITSALGNAAARSSEASNKTLPGPGRQPASDPVLASAGTIVTEMASGRLILRAVRFSPDGTTMTAPDNASISRIAAAILVTKDLYAIEAHVPMNGATWRTARTVSSSEAQAFKAALVKAGVPESRLAAVGYGAAIPEKEDDTNPRIEIVRLR